MQFLSDNAASVHPKVWAAMQAADQADAPYDGDRLSAALNDRFSALFNRPCTVLWVASGTAANCLALSTMVEPHGAVICHREAHIESDEGGAPGFYLHGAKLILGEGHGAKLSPEGIGRILADNRGDVHQVQPDAISVTQVSEYGLCYRPDEVRKIAGLARDHGLKLHMDGARFANAVAFLECDPAEACAGVDALSFGCVKNGGLGAEAMVFFDRDLAKTAHHRRKRAGHLQSKGRYLAAQILAMLDGDLWLENARAANGAAALIAEGAGERLLYKVEANEVFVTMGEAERADLRDQGFGFYDWGQNGARFVTAWDSNHADARALGAALARL